MKIMNDLKEIFEEKKYCERHTIFKEVVDDKNTDNTAACEKLNNMADISMALVSDDQASLIYRLLLRNITNKPQFHDYLSQVLLPQAVEMVISVKQSLTEPIPMINSNAVPSRETSQVITDESSESSTDTDSDHSFASASTLIIGCDTDDSPVEEKMELGEWRHEPPTAARKLKSFNDPESHTLKYKAPDVDSALTVETSNDHEISIHNLKGKTPDVENALTVKSFNDPQSHTLKYKAPDVDSALTVETSKDHEIFIHSLKGKTPDVENALTVKSFNDPESHTLKYKAPDVNSALTVETSKDHEISIHNLKGKAPDVKNALTVKSFNDPEIHTLKYEAPDVDSALKVETSKDHEIFIRNWKGKTPDVENALTVKSFNDPESDTLKYKAPDVDSALTVETSNDHEISIRNLKGKAPDVDNALTVKTSKDHEIFIHNWKGKTPDVENALTVKSFNDPESHTLKYKAPDVDSALTVETSKDHEIFIHNWKGKTPDVENALTVKSFNDPESDTLKYKAPDVDSALTVETSNDHEISIRNLKGKAPDVDNALTVKTSKDHEIFIHNWKGKTPDVENALTVKSFNDPESHTLKYKAPDVDSALTVETSKDHEIFIHNWKGKTPDVENALTVKSFNDPESDTLKYKAPDVDSALTVETSNDHEISIRNLKGKAPDVENALTVKPILQDSIQKMLRPRKPLQLPPDIDDSSDYNNESQLDDSGVLSESEEDDQMSDDPASDCDEDYIPDVAEFSDSNDFDPEIPEFSDDSDDEEVVEDIVCKIIAAANPTESSVIKDIEEKLEKNNGNKSSYDNKDCEPKEDYEPEEECNSGIEDSNEGVEPELGGEEKDTSKQTSNKSWSLETEIRSRKDGHKEHFCLFCGVREFKLPRHLERHHKEETEVKEVLSLVKGSKQRAEAWRKLTRKGDYEANLKSLKENSQFLAVTRKPPPDKDTNDFVPCPHCLGFFSARNLYMHGKTCFNKFDSNDTQRLLEAGRTLLSTSISNGMYQEVHRILLPKIKRDDLHLLIRNDSSLLLYGAVQLQTKEKDQYKDIRYSLRVLARLVIEVRKSKPDVRAKDLVMPENFDIVVAAAKSMTSFTGPRSIKTPNTFLKCGYCLRRLSLMVRSAALRESSNDILNKVRNFQELYDTDWQLFAKQARDCHNAKKGNAPEELPLESDVRKFREFVVRQIKELVKNADTQQCPWKLKKLAKLTLGRLLTFNARRGTEVSKLKLKHWKAVMDGRWKRRTDIESLDDPIEKVLAQRLELCYVEGKKKRGGSKGNSLVPILFTPESVAAVKLIVTSISQSDDERYIFASGDLYLQGWDTLQGICALMDNLEQPKLITPTRTRKFMSTILQLLDMSDAELTWITNHFGHTKNVHLSWYRREDATIELTKMAKVLVAVDDGKKLKNKKIDEIGNAENDDEIEEEEEEEDIAGSNLEFPHIQETQTTNLMTSSKDSNLTNPSEAEFSGENSNKRKQPRSFELETVSVRKKTKQWQQWTTEEEKILKKAFRFHYVQNVVPSVFDVRTQLEKYPALEKRGVTKIRDKIRNQLKKSGKVK